MRLERILKNKYVLLFTIILLHGNIAWAQKSPKALRTGQELLELGYYIRALDKFNQLLQSDSSNSKVNLLASYCYLELQQPNEALILINKTKSDNECKYYLEAMANYLLEDFNRANKILSGVENHECPYHDNKQELERLINDASTSYSKTKGYILTNFGSSINTIEREYSAVMINKFDSILFTSRRKESKASLAEDGMPYESIFITGVNMNDEWTAPVEFKSTVDSKFSHDATVQIFDEGRKVIVFHDGDLYLAEKKGFQWAIKEKLDIINTSQNETHCFITPDQKTIYFSSDYQTENGDLDLFVTHKISENSWSKPDPIDELNTPFDEDAPFLSDDNIFYFSSRGHNSIGGFDVFATRYDQTNDTWAPIVNMGHPINTVADDIYYTTFGKLAYISSSRPGGHGLLDLYRIFLFNNIKMQGKILNQNNQEPIPGATIDFEYGPWFLRGYSDIDGNYEMHVPINKNMRVTIQKDSTNIHSGNYMVKVFLDEDNNNHYNFTVDLDPLESDEPVLSADLLSFSDTVMIKLHVKNDLDKNNYINKVPQSKEKQWVDSLNLLYGNRFSYMEDATDLNTDEIRIHFEFNGSTLSDSSKAVLMEFINSLSQHEFQYLEVGGHTDKIGSDRFNLLLSMKRANTVNSFLLENGISSNNIIVKGYGEKVPLENEISEKASAENRRVEIKVIK